jgi:twitching motility protein PilT
MHINDLLRIATERQASDLHLKGGAYPVIRVDGTLTPLVELKRMMQEDTIAMAFSIMSARQKEKFKNNFEIDIAYSVPDLGRFRCNIFQQRGTVGLVLRVIPSRILGVRDLLLPPVIERICSEQRGLVLCTGTTGSGKSTTLAAMIDFINATRNEHIMTVEDPIEFLHRDKKSIVNQREVEVDTKGFSVALRSALRQDPDVILVGEMRDYETVETALTAAETGHLVLSTLHTLDATETINRIVAIFPPHQQKQIRLQLAAVLKAVISLRLMPRADNLGRVPAAEILISTALVRDCIENKGRPSSSRTRSRRARRSTGCRRSTSRFSTLQVGPDHARRGLERATGERVPLEAPGDQSTSGRRPGRDGRGAPDARGGRSAVGGISIRFFQPASGNGRAAVARAKVRALPLATGGAGPFRTPLHRRGRLGAGLRR